MRGARQPAGNLFCLRSANHKPRVLGAGMSGRLTMLRFKILASALPLLVAAVIARGGLLPGPRPCITVGDASVEIASIPWHADLHVSFTDDPAAATVRVQISDSAAAADFVVVDGDDSSETGSCVTTAATLFVAVSGNSAQRAPVIYLSPDGPADYRIFVRSKTFTVRDAAALIVGARDGHNRFTAASL
jgi:hypothetical protein